MGKNSFMYFNDSMYVHGFLTHYNILKNIKFTQCLKTEQFLV